jgi:hypothetical protein
MFMDDFKFKFDFPTGETLVIPTYNNFTYLNTFMSQNLVKQFDRVIILDNGSKYPRFLNYLSELNAKQNVQVFFLERNYGPRFCLMSEFYHYLPRVFFLSDCDLKFSNLNLFDLNTFFDTLTNKFSVGKIALDLFNSDVDPNLVIKHDGQFISIGDWYRKVRGDDIFQDSKFTVSKGYSDTTFCRIDKNFFDPNNHIDSLIVRSKIGSPLVQHLPWFNTVVIPDEEKHYYKNNLHSNWYGGNSISVDEVLIRKDDYQALVEENFLLRQQLWKYHH